MNNRSALLTLDRLRLAMTRNETARKRAVGTETTTSAHHATVQRDLLALR